jgi:hypothetical protein
VTESRDSSPKPPARATKPTRVVPSKGAASRAAAKTAPATDAAPARVAKTPKAAASTAKAAAPIAKALAAVPPNAPSYRHPNLGLAPVGMTAGYPAAAERLRGDQMRISASALEAAAEADPTLRARYDDAGLRRLLRDGELFVERLAMCLGSDDDRWLSEYAEWIAPIYRRRRVPLNDLSALCAGIARTVEPMLTPDEFTAATGSLEAATAVFRRTSRIAGDRHKRNTLWKWMYRGV